MSLGTMTNVGFGALAASPAIGNLQRLDPNRHYAGNEGVAQIRKLGIPTLDLRGAQGESDEDDRYVDVNE